MIITAKYAFIPFAIVCTAAAHGADGLRAALSRHTEEIDNLIDTSRDRHIESQALKENFARVRLGADEDRGTKALVDIVHLSLFHRGRGQDTGYIESQPVLDVLVSALDDENGNVRELALDLLWEHARPRDLRPYADRLLGAAHRIVDNKMYFLLGMTDSRSVVPFLTELAEDGIAIPRQVHARLGDAKAEMELLEEFQGETDPRRKGEKALVLGYVSTPRCAKALASELRSPLVVTTRHYEYSLRYKVLEALGMIYTDEPLFTSGLLSVVRTHNDGQSGALRGEEYFDRVEAWCTRHLGVQYHGDRPPFLLYRLTNAPHSMPTADRP